MRFASVLVLALVLAAGLSCARKREWGARASSPAVKIHSSDQKTWPRPRIGLYRSEDGSVAYRDLWLRGDSTFRLSCIADPPMPEYSDISGTWSVDGGVLTLHAHYARADISVYPTWEVSYRIESPKRLRVLENEIPMALVWAEGD